MVYIFWTLNILLYHYKIELEIQSPIKVIQKQKIRFVDGQTDGQKTDDGQMPRGIT